MSIKFYVRKSLKKAMEADILVKDGQIDKEALVEIIVQTIHQTITSPEYIEYIRRAVGAQVP